MNPVAAQHSSAPMERSGMGEGDRPKGGGGGVQLGGLSSSPTPPPPPCARFASFGWSPSPASRGRKWKYVSAAHPRPGFESVAVARMSVSEIRGKQQGFNAVPGFRFVHPGYDRKKKGRRNAGKRVVLTSASFQMRRACERRARLSAFHRGSDRWAFRPAGAASGHASWDEAGRLILYGPLNRERKTSRSSTGVTRARQSQSRECTSRTGRSAGQLMPEAARERSVSFRARAPHSLRLREAIMRYLT